MKQTQSKITHRRGFLTAFGVLALLALAAPQIAAQGATSLTLDDKPLHCALPAGETTLIVHVPNASLLERFELVNENGDAQGQFRIAVADSRLSANDPKWNAVSGNIAFSHKRLFNLSMVGVDAKFVKLSFHVEKEKRIAAIDL